MRAVRTVLATTVSLGVMLAVPAVATAAVMGDWQLDEAPGAPLAIDGSGQGLHGDVGEDVVLYEATGDGGRAYRFQGDWWVVNRERLVLWADQPRLDPQTTTYAVTVRVKTRAPNTNVIQKGQANVAGGFWKLEIHRGWPTCHFRDSSGRNRAIKMENHPNPNAYVADGVWTTIRCERTTTGVTVTVNPGEATQVSSTTRGTLGNVDNNNPLSLGGKWYCNGDTITCDYYAGAVDWVRIEKGP